LQGLGLRAWNLAISFLSFLQTRTVIPCCIEGDGAAEEARDNGWRRSVRKRRDLFVEVLPIEPARKLDQLVLHVDDLIEPRSEGLRVRNERSRPLVVVLEAWPLFLETREPNPQCPATKRSKN